MSKFRRGTIAINHRGQLGYIQTVYEMEMGGVQCGGFRLDVAHGGEKWIGVDPEYVTHVDDLLYRHMENDTYTITPTGAEVRTYPHGLLPCPALAVVVDSPLPMRDDDPVHDCSGGEISSSPVTSKPARRSCI